MSFPILKAKDGNEFYNKYLDSITSFGNMYVAPDIFGKNAVLEKNKSKRPLTKKEIETFIKIYLLSKLNLFYSKIDYTFTLNVDNYYKYYYNSLNKFDNLCRFYLNLENPAVKRINFEIHQKMILDQKIKNSDKNIIYDLIISDNEEIIKMLNTLVIFLDGMINKNKARDKQYNKIDSLLTKMTPLLTKVKTVYGNATVNTNINISDFYKRLNNMFDKIEPFAQTNDNVHNYTPKYNKLKEYIRDYQDLFKIYQSLLLIFSSYDFNINFELNKDTNINTFRNTNLNPIIIQSRNLVIIYGLFKKNILDNIKTLEKINLNIEKLKNIKNEDQTKILGDIDFSKIEFIKSIPANTLYNALNTKTMAAININYSTGANIITPETFKDEYFYKLLYYVLAYINNNVILKKNYFKNLKNPANANTNLIAIINNTNNKILLKKSIEDLQKSLKDKEENIDEKINDSVEEKKDLNNEIADWNSKKFDDDIKAINDKILENEKNIRDIDSNIAIKNREKTKLEGSRVGKVQTNLDIINPQITALQTEIDELNRQKTQLTNEKESLKKNKKSFELLEYQKNTNINILNMKLKLQDELNKKYGELKSSNPFKDFKPEEFIAFDESLKKFSKSITKESSKTSKKNPIVSYFTQNYLYLLYSKPTTSTSSTKNIDKLKELFQLFYNKSKSLIRTNKNKEEQPNFNEDFIEKINNYINNTEFKEFIENTNNEFKSTIAKLLKKYKNKNKFKYIDKNVTTVYNIKTLNTIIQKCIRNEITYEEYNKNITKKIYPYTNFIIAYFAIYLIIINKILANLKII